jgi:hypothetical protein
MTTASDVLADGIERIRDLVSSTAEGLSADDLAYRPAPEANSIGWLLWHLTRVEDGHVAELAGDEQLWVRDGFAESLGFAPDPHDSGYGHTAEQSAAVRIERPDALVAYHEAVAERSLSFLRDRGDGELDRVVDESYDPPVTEAVRWVSILGDCLMHAGQAQYVAGILPRRASTSG